MSAIRPLSSGDPDGYFHFRRFLADLKIVTTNPNQAQKSFLAKSVLPPI